jgi:secondary thiamine-phosphate synthase enzyme
MDMPVSSFSRQAVSSRRRCEMIDVTQRVEQAVRESGAAGGLVVVHVPHTTAGVTVNENADPDVKHDLLAKLEQLIPHRESFYQHAEGNSDSHLKASMMGSSSTIILHEGRLVLGRWQGIYLCEFDGPRTREIVIKVLADPL